MRSSGNSRRHAVFVVLTAELSVRAKSDLLFREVELDLFPDPRLVPAIRPLLSQTRLDLWEMRQFAQG
jgi:hypothetical protein